MLLACSTYELIWNNYILHLIYIFDKCKTLNDANQTNKEMTKDAHYEKSSQQSSEDFTKDLADLARGRNGHKPEHLMFFLLVFLKNKTSCK